MTAEQIGKVLREQIAGLLTALPGDRVAVVPVVVVVVTGNRLYLERDLERELQVER